jgi:hypothetical protein
MMRVPLLLLLGLLIEGLNSTDAEEDTQLSQPGFLSYYFYWHFPARIPLPT